MCVCVCVFVFVFVCVCFNVFILMYNFCVYVCVCVCICDYVSLCTPVRSCSHRAFFKHVHDRVCMREFVYFLENSSSDF